jgi:hypothetical protein
VAKDENTESTEVARTVPILSDDALREMESMEDALRVLQDSGVAPVNIADEMGDGFSLLESAEDKRRLVKTEFVVLSWTFSDGDYGEPFVSMRVMTKAGGKFIVNDGGTGIRAQLQAYTAKTGRQHGMYVPQGLRVSDYFIHRETHEPVARNYDGPKDPAATFYLSTNK